MSDVIETRKLSKRYGSTTVVDGIDLRVPRGSVYGFLGPNGAGKSTTMKMLLSLIRPTSGEVQILGRRMDRSSRIELLSMIGSLIEAPPGYAHLTGRDNMRIVQKQLGLNDGAVDRAVRTVRLQDQMDKKVAKYSLGMKQRLGIAMALAREPQLLVLDEPTNGLDPSGIEEMRDLLRRLAAGGVTVMVSSHLLDEVDKMASVLGIIDNGRLIFQGTREQLHACAPPTLIIDSADPVAAAEIFGSGERQGSRLRVAGQTPQITAAGIARLVRRGVDVYEVVNEPQSLEKVFMDLTGGGTRS